MSIKLTLYSRTGCHLCEDMEQALPELATELDFNTEIVLIDNNNELEQIYGTKVTLLTLGDDIICEYFLNSISNSLNISVVFFLAE